MDESVTPLLEQDRAGVDDVGDVGGVVEERELNLVLHEDVSRTQTTVDNVFGVKVTQSICNLSNCNIVDLKKRDVINRKPLNVKSTSFRVS